MEMRRVVLSVREQTECSKFKLVFQMNDSIWQPTCPSTSSLGVVRWHASCSVVVQMVRILGSHPSDPGSSPGNGSSRDKRDYLLDIATILLCCQSPWRCSPIHSCRYLTSQEACKMNECKHFACIIQCLLHGHLPLLVCLARPTLYRANIFDGVYPGCRALTISLVSNIVPCSMGSIVFPPHDTTVCMRMFHAIFCPRGLS